MRRKLLKFNLPVTFDNYTSPSFANFGHLKVKVAFIAENAEVVNLKVYGGKNHSNGDFLSFFKETEQRLPANYVLKGDTNEQDLWQELDRVYIVAEFTIPLPKWSKARRFIFREKMEPKTGDSTNIRL